ncbi:serine hydrolase [Simplicispira psychrophila]|uniref:serine hydrolase n=1 Tax=Simplicispira psychrophila TaxID=80882 RepID=UPI000AAEF7BB|nr:serine hydrolase [Simplicispira psychrophila]
MKKMLAPALAVALTVGGTAMAQAPAPMSAQASSPQAMGWMQGSPPAADKTIRFTDPDFFAFPKLRWTVCNFRQLMPTVGVDNGSQGASTLPTALDASLDQVSFTPLGTDKKMSWKAAFDANYSDGVIVLHHGRVVYERYDGCLGPQALHGAMSVTKSLTGLLAEVLVAEGQLDENARVGTLIPELQASAFGDATVRQVMDMTTALDYSENYADPNAEVWTYAKAGSPLPPPPGYTGPRSYFEFLQTVKKKGEHGAAFGYKTVNADTLGWLIARTTGKSVAQELSERLWSRLGTEREAFYTVDSIGTPFAGGGFNATLRDMARLGQLMLNDGRWGDEQLVPPEAIAHIRHGGKKDIFARADYKLLPGWSYASLWWISNDDHGAYAARGVHGQTLWVDPKADMVIVRFASHPVAANAASDPTSLPAYRAVANHLMAHDKTPLLGQAWVIEAIAGGGLIDNSHVTLQFLPDGRLAGSATCNRILGRYEAEATKLRIKPAGTTMMMCPPALMHQERKLLDLLPTVASYRIDSTGALVLSTAGGQTILARRSQGG